MVSDVLIVPLWATEFAVCRLSMRARRSLSALLLILVAESDGIWYIVVTQPIKLLAHRVCRHLVFVLAADVQTLEMTGFINTTGVFRWSLLPTNSAAWRGEAVAPSLSDIGRRSLLLLMKQLVIVLNPYQLTLVISLLSLPSGNRSSAACSIRRTISLWAKLTCVITTRGHSRVFRGATLLEKNLLSEVRDGCSDLRLLRRVAACAERLLLLNEHLVMHLVVMHHLGSHVVKGSMVCLLCLHEWMIYELNRVVQLALCEELVRWRKTVIRVIQKVYHSWVVIMGGDRVKQNLSLVLQVVRPVAAWELLRKLHVWVQMRQHLLLIVNLRALTWASYIIHWSNNVIIIFLISNQERLVLIPISRLNLWCRRS